LSDGYFFFYALFLSFSFLLHAVLRPIGFIKPGSSVVPVKKAKFSGAPFQKFQPDIPDVQCSEKKPKRAVHCSKLPD